MTMTTSSAMRLNLSAATASASAPLALTSLPCEDVGLIEVRLDLSPGKQIKSSSVGNMYDGHFACFGLVWTH